MGNWINYSLILSSCMFNLINFVLVHKHMCKNQRKCLRYATLMHSHDKEPSLCHPVLLSWYLLPSGSKKVAPVRNRDAAYATDCLEILVDIRAPLLKKHLLWSDLPSRGSWIGQQGTHGFTSSWLTSLCLGGNRRYD